MKLPSQLFLMGLYHGRQVGKAVIKVDNGRRRHGGPPALLHREGALGTAVDPCRGKTQILGRDMIMVQALGDMEDVVLTITKLGEPIQKIKEIGRVRLVGPDVLGCIHGSKGSPQLGCAATETLLVHVGKNHQTVMSLQIAQRCGCIGKGGPLADGLAEALVVDGCG